MIRQRITRAIAYALFGAVLAAFSAWPTFAPLAPGNALVRLSMSVSGDRIGECRTLEPAERERLPANMRTIQICPRERSDVRVRLLIDEQPVVDELLPPRGWANDGASVIYRRIPVAAGQYRITAQVHTGGSAPGARHERTQVVTLGSGALLTIDFDPSRGGVLLR